MKIRSSRFFALLTAFFFVPTVAFAQIPGINFGDLIDMPEAPALPSFSCEVEGSIKRINNVSNEVTYKISYATNFDKINAKYQVDATIDYTIRVANVYHAGGATSFTSAGKYIMQQGGVEKKFTFAIDKAPGVTVKAKVENFECKSKFFKTLPASSLISGIQPTIPDLRLNPNAQVTTSVNINLGDDNNEQPLPQPESPQNQTCKVLTEAALKDTDTVLIGAAIDFSDLKAGSYPYVVRGYKNDDPNNVRKYEGTYVAKVNEDRGLVFNQEGKAFLYTFDSQSQNDGYVITATLGNIDCSAVLFPSPLKLAAEANAGVATADAGEVVALGASSEDESRAAELDLLTKTGDVDAALLSEINKNDNQNVADTFTPATGAETPSADNAWTGKDYTMAGLLGAILLSLIAFIGLRYKGII